MRMPVHYVRAASVRESERIILRGACRLTGAYRNQLAMYLSIHAPARLHHAAFVRASAQVPGEQPERLQRGVLPEQAPGHHREIRAVMENQLRQ